MKNKKFPVMVTPGALACVIEYYRGLGKEQEMTAEVYEFDGKRFTRFLIALKNRNPYAQWSDEGDYRTAGTLANAIANCLKGIFQIEVKEED